MLKNIFAVGVQEKHRTVMRDAAAQHGHSGKIVKNDCIGRERRARNLFSGTSGSVQAMRAQTKYSWFFRFAKIQKADGGTGGIVPNHQPDERLHAA
jgi:hypothetical protein